MKQYSLRCIFYSLFLALFACGGNGGGSSATETDTGGGDSPTPQTGVFIDSPVENIGYRTETLSGFTNASGEFSYLPGETITFFIGALELPSATAKSTLTPLDLANTQDISNPTVVNIIRLLQTLDTNSDPKDGITIDDKAANNAIAVDFTQGIESFASSSAVRDLIRDAGLESPVTELISVSEAIANFELGLAGIFSMDMTQKAAFSSIKNSSCPDVLGGWSYTFKGESMTLTGVDSWNEPACTLNATETLIEDMNNLPQMHDLPFNCTEYPVCKSADLNKIISGVDEDNNSFTSSYSFNRETNVLTYIKSVAGTVYTEVITIEDNFSINMTQKTARSSIINSSCPDVPGGWSYTFTGESMTLTGVDSWNEPACTLNAAETLIEDMSNLPQMHDLPFNCTEYPVCKSADLNKIISGVDEDNRRFTSTYSFNRETNVLTYIKSVGGVNYTELITIEDGNFSMDMTQKTASSIITYSFCPEVPLGWSYTFNANSMTLTGADGWQSSGCIPSATETYTEDMRKLSKAHDLPFNCAEYPICKFSDFNKIISGLDEEGRRFSSSYRFDRKANVLTYIQARVRSDGRTSIFTEVITIK